VALAALNLNLFPILKFHLFHFELQLASCAMIVECWGPGHCRVLGNDLGVVKLSLYTSKQAT
jgi:hypothetical protein